MRRTLIGVLVAMVAGVLIAPTSAGAASTQSATGEIPVLTRRVPRPRPPGRPSRRPAAPWSARTPRSAWPPCAPRRPTSSSRRRHSAIAAVEGNRPSGVLVPRAAAPRSSGTPSRPRPATPAVPPPRIPEAAPPPSRWPTCSGTCSRSAPPPPARTASSRAPAACRSASSTPASTARTPTSPRTSTPAQPQLHRRHPGRRQRRPVDGPCEDEPDQLLQRPRRRRRERPRHPRGLAPSPRRSTASASPASPPRSTIVNLRAGQDSGYFFLQPSVDALTYAGDNGIDVVNMSYYVDPWLFNCADNPADSPDGPGRAAHDHHGHAAGARLRHDRGRDAGGGRRQRRIDYTKPISDGSSPDFASEPGEAPRDRDRSTRRRASRCQPRAST